MSDHAGPARFYLIRHATVEPASLAMLYGQMDVPICNVRLAHDAPRYAALGIRLPKPANWVVTSLSRTRMTAEAIMSSGYGIVRFETEPALIEQDFGAWQGLPIHQFADRPAQHPFWPVGSDEQPPGGESFSDMRHRVSIALDRLAKAHAGQAIVAVSHGGPIRAAVAHALDLSSHQALSLAVDNLSLTRLERYAHAWRMVSLNEQISI